LRREEIGSPRPVRALCLGDRRLERAAAVNCSAGGGCFQQLVHRVGNLCRRRHPQPLRDRPIPKPRRPGLQRPADHRGQIDPPRHQHVRKQRMRPLSAALVGAQHPPDRHPPPADVARIPAIEVDRHMPARRARQRPRHLHPDARSQPDIDGDIEHEYDLHRLLRSVHDPRTRTTSRGLTTFTDTTASSMPSPLATTSRDGTDPGENKPLQRQTVASNSTQQERCHRGQWQLPGERAG